MLKFTIKRGDTSPALRFALLPDSVSLAGAAVRFQMRARGGDTLIDRPADIQNLFEPAVVAHLWAQGDTETTGRYEAEFRVTYLDGSTETFPNLGFIEVFVTEDVPGLSG
ncbi:hypothetical protein HAT86_08840 [Roseovarius gahaiensis]|uniref:BppU N-terminal domain-containing protein n=1 Tax=Roseovarius gahaiensis TaxID=2716691 RepID=A0A967EKK4_9RHOB|nr:hypothetical protein [Roseovarius gahaiensis]NHQ74569.1 hypothetical protein [Roseovarius gahaiensis]